jgi:asparagine synthase (glutamine-hydrolysing)
MCGIAGIVSLRGDADEQRVRSMVDTLRHRGPDEAAFWQSPAATVCLGHSRLSIIDLSRTGRQPMAYADGRFHITYNGEIYNYVELHVRHGGPARGLRRPG